MSDLQQTQETITLVPALVFEQYDLAGLRTVRADQQEIHTLANEIKRLIGECSRMTWDPPEGVLTVPSTQWLLAGVVEMFDDAQLGPSMQNPTSTSAVLSVFTRNEVQRSVLLELPEKPMTTVPAVLYTGWRTLHLSPLVDFLDLVNPVDAAIKEYGLTANIPHILLPEQH